MTISETEIPSGVVCSDCDVTLGQVYFAKNYTQLSVYTQLSSFKNVDIYIILYSSKISNFNLYTI